MLKRDEKKKIIKNFRTHNNDTGSLEVQVAVLTERIKRLVEHLKKNKKDHHSRRGLLGMVAKRKKFLNYIQTHSKEKFAEIVKALKLKAAKSIEIRETEEEKQKNESRKE